MLTESVSASVRVVGPSPSSSLTTASLARTAATNDPDSTAQSIARVIPTAHFLTTDQSGQAEGPDLTFVPGQKVLVSFTLPQVNTGNFPASGNYPAIWGVLHLNWVGRAVVIPPPIKVRFGSEEETTEAKITEALRTLPPEIVQKMIGALPLGKPGKLRVIQPRTKPRVLRSIKDIPVPHKPPQAVAIADPAKVKLDALRRQLLCQQFGGKVPGVDICH